MLMDKETVADIEAAPVADKISTLILAAKAKKILQAAHGENLLSNSYQAPQMAPTPVTQVPTNYQLIEPVAAQQPMQYYYPQNFEVQAPLPVPQMMTP